jgi:hypothetical protein
VLLEHKKRLAKLPAEVLGGLPYVQHLEGDGPVVFEPLQAWLEGIVSKLVQCELASVGLWGLCLFLLCRGSQ